MSEPFFWRSRSLEQLSREEWESLCDRCGQCCLHKLRDEETEKIHYTEVSCFLLNTKTGQCRHYSRRHNYVPDCIELTPENLKTIDWLPPTCAYRLLQEGQDLPPWHPLISGRIDSVIEAGISVKGRCISEHHAGPLEDHIVTWPHRKKTQKKKKT
ncbi:YcgN family cysteine cluster protein [Entomobacter blattae]|uniref:UPF0260 protein JGUZn3_04400 n=1 Tax=Entomobacter blattae TaxID=2762277 RepID=A0A7H1NPI0_9PROT|nr:YcgN family cysteine cluster protein [Entomobacter blattae]QNT77690.1 hypothetical protein JGUZn3_04400 [Entomobacter blattae]